VKKRKNSIISVTLCHRPWRQ